ncbi:MAG: ComEC/Rec2 family competence protein, partial [Flavobacterium sp.]|nr:ComEC/Rec2 family competence protein [Pedobacter sp.]
FHQFPVYFLISNLLVLLPVSLIMYAGITFLFIPWLSLLKPLGYFLNQLILWTNKILYFIEDLPFSSISGIWISKSEYILLYFLIAGIIWTALSAKKIGVYICLGLILCLVTSLTLKNIGYLRNRELIFYSLRKNSAIAYIQHKNAYLINDLGNDEKTMQFSLKPVLDSRGVKLIKNITFQDTISDISFRSSPIQMTFGNTRVLRWSRRMDNLTFSQIIRTDIVLISGNPKTSISNIKRNVAFTMLLIDATNPDYKISKWKVEADSLKIPVRILKKSPAYILKF